MKMINISTVLNNKFGMSADQGEQIAVLIEEALSTDEKVILNFEGMIAISTRFIFSSFGYLFDPDNPLNQLTSKLNFQTSDKEMKFQIHRGIDWAKVYYQDKEIVIA